MGQRSRNVRSTILQVMVVLVATFYWTPSLAQEDDFEDDFFDTYNSCSWIHWAGTTPVVTDTGFGVIAANEPDPAHPCNEYAAAVCAQLFEGAVDNIGGASNGRTELKCTFTKNGTQPGFPAWYRGSIAVSTCQEGKLFNPWKNGGICESFCTTPGETWLEELDGDCGDPDNPGGEDEPPTDKGDPCGVGNPCNPANGNKYQRDVDFTTSNFTLVRSYNSLHLTDVGFGKGWTAFTFKRLAFVDPNTLWRVEANGRGDPWYNEGSVWITDDDVDIELIQTPAGFTVTLTNGDVETYNLDGRLITENTASGRPTAYSYNASDQLLSVTRHFGHALNLTWDMTGHISSITDPAGGVYTYSYDANTNLVSVDYPDSTTRTYHYENGSYPNHLTGITDENGDRIATYAYDSQGRAISTEHADIGGGGAQEKFQIDYGQ